MYKFFSIIKICSEASNVTKFLSVSHTHHFKNETKPIQNLLKFVKQPEKEVENFYEKENYIKESKKK